VRSEKRDEDVSTTTHDEIRTVTDTDDPELYGREVVEEQIELVGLLAEFDSVDDVVLAAQAVRRAGFLRWDVHSPFPIHGIEFAMGIKPTILPLLVLGAGLTGMVGGLLLQWYTNAYDYPYFVSGKPLFSLPAFIPVTFELTILLASLTAVFGMLILNRLPRLYNPLFKHERFRRVTDDRFFIYVDATDPKFDEAETVRLLGQAGALAIERVED
jgi:Protein of unknown function (DUF3341)